MLQRRRENGERANPLHLRSDVLPPKEVTMSNAQK